MVREVIIIDENRRFNCVLLWSKSLFMYLQFVCFLVELVTNYVIITVSKRCACS